MQYRRAKKKGGTYFFTVNLADRKSDLLVEYVEDLRDVVKKVKQQHPFHIDAMVVLPDHLHAIWTLPKEDADYPKRWMLIKSRLSRRIPKSEYRRKSRISKGERGVRQRRYWEHMIRNERDFEQHVNYVHYNPVKHGYVEKAVEWKHSSIQRYIKEGVISHNWGSKDIFQRDNFGDRT
jgi:putative transposase